MKSGVLERLIVIVAMFAIVFRMFAVAESEFDQLLAAALLLLTGVINTTWAAAEKK